MPRSAALVLSPTTPEIAQTLQLPVHGHALRYPFDTYELLLGISVQRVGADGVPQARPRTEAANLLRLTLREALPLFKMSAPVAIDPTTARGAGPQYEYLYLEAVAFKRPLDVQITAVVLVCLTAVVAAFAVFMKPLDELVVGAGGLILAPWGIRGLIVPSGITYTTLVDLGLALVMGFLLTAISARGLVHLWHRNRLPVPGVPTARTTPPGAKPPT